MSPLAFTQSGEGGGLKIMFSIEMFNKYISVLGIIFLDPDPLIRDPDPSIIKQK